MNYIFFAVCDDSYPYRDIGSLNECISEFQDVESPDLELVETITDPHPGLFDQHYVHQLHQAVGAFVDSLPANLRRIARLHYWNDLSQADIARFLGVSRSAVSQAINRINELGRKALSPFLQ